MSSVETHLACNETFDRIRQHDGHCEQNSSHVDQVIAVTVILQNVSCERHHTHPLAQHVAKCALL